MTLTTRLISTTTMSTTLTATLPPNIITINQTSIPEILTATQQVTDITMIPIGVTYIVIIVVIIGIIVLI